MRVFYASMTGNIKRFLTKSGLEHFNIADYPKTSEPFVLVTYTFGFGNVPQEVAKWLTENSEYMVGVASSGNRNWGDNYAKAGDIIAFKYGVPLLLKFEQAGNDTDIKHFTERVAQLEKDLLRIK